MKNILLATIFVFGSGSAFLTSAQQQSVTNRPADVKVSFSNSSTYKGTYQGHAASRVCGQTDPMYFGKKSFLFDYPLDLENPEDPITDVGFSSDELVDGVKMTNRFHVQVSVHGPAIGSPPAFVVDTGIPNGKSSGEATLKVNGESLELTVTAVDSLGAKLELLVVCRPAKK